MQIMNIANQTQKEILSLFSHSVLSYLDNVHVRYNSCESNLLVPVPFERNSPFQIHRLAL